MYILLILIAILLIFSVAFWANHRRKHHQQLLAAPFFSTATTRKLTADEQDAVQTYLSTLFQYQQTPLNTLPTDTSPLVYTVTRAITRYGLTTDEPYKWRYYLDSNEVHLPPFWEQYISDDNQIDIIPTATLPLVIALNGHTLLDYMGESRSLLPESTGIGYSSLSGQESGTIEILRIRKETWAEHALNSSNGWPQALMIVLAFLLFFFCLKAPDVLISWLVIAASLLLLAGISGIFFPPWYARKREIHCLYGTPKCWGLFGESDRQHINTISLGTIDLIYPKHWQPFIHHELGQKTNIDIDLNRQVIRQGEVLSLHDEVKNFPIPHWIRSSIIALGSCLVLILLFVTVPLEMPLMLTTSWLKGAKTIDVSDVTQLEKTTLQVGDTLNINGSGMCSIHPGAWTSHKNSPFTPFDCSQIIWNPDHPLSLPQSDIVTKASALLQEVNQQLYPRHNITTDVNPQLASAIKQSDMVLLTNFPAIVLKTQALCTDDDECIRLKNALVNLGNIKDWETLTRLVNAGQLTGVNVLLRPISAEALNNLVTASVAPFFIRETSRAAQALNSTLPGGFIIVNEEGGELVDQAFPSISLYDYPPQEQWAEFQRLANMLLQTPFVAEGVITSLRNNPSGTQYIVLHSIPDSTSISRYIGTTLLLIVTILCTLYHTIMAIHRKRRSRSRLTEIQRYYEHCLNTRLTESSSGSLF